MPKAGSSIRKLARGRRNNSFLQFGGAGALVFALAFMYPLLGTTSLGVLVYVFCLVGAVILYQKGQSYWKKANRAN